MMRSSLLLPAALVILAPSLLSAQSRLLPDVKEIHCSNGLTVLVVERPAAGALHASLFIRGGRASTGGLASCAADLLAHSLFDRLVLPDQASRARAEALLGEEEGMAEALRLSRLKGGPGQAGDGDLVAARARVLDNLRVLLGDGDLLDAAQVLHRRVEVGADWMAWSGELPAPRFRPLAEGLAGALSQPLLADLPWERDRLASARDPEETVLQILLSAATLQGGYGRAGAIQPGELAALRWSDVRKWARTALQPGRMTLVLVGDCRFAEVERIVGETLGKLPALGGGGGEEVWSGFSTPWEGARKMSVTMPGVRRTLLVWRMPPLSHPDAPVLQLLAQILGTGSGSRLNKALCDEQGVASRVSVRLGVPGGRETNLFVVEAEPAEGRGLDELTQALMAEMQRFYAEPLMDGTIQRAQRQAEGLAQAVQEDAGTLAEELGAAQVQVGDWRAAFLSVRLGSELRQERMQAVLRRYLAPEQSLSLALEPDLLSTPRDLEEVKLVKILEQLAQKRTQDSARVDAIVRDVLQQIRMLPPDARAKTLGLLEAQVPR
nr:insulinase family protein [uncultured Holophaga sp.]